MFIGANKISRRLSSPQIAACAAKTVRVGRHASRKDTAENECLRRLFKKVEISVPRQCINAVSFFTFVYIITNWTASLQR